MEIQRLLRYLGNFTVTDLLGFAKIVGADEQRDFEEFLSVILTKYSALPRKQRKHLLKLAKEISMDNRQTGIKKNEIQE